MTVADLLRRARKKLDDVTGTSTTKFWTDEQLINDYGNKAMDDMCRKTRLLIIQTDDISIVAATPTYDLAEYILDVLRIKPASRSPLIRCEVDELDRDCPGWEDYAAANPWGYIPDMNTQAITFVPTPVATETATMKVGRLPATYMDYLIPAASPEIPTRYHANLIPGICAQALDDGDDDAIRPQMAAKFQAEFDNRCEMIKRELYMQLSSGNVLNRIPSGLLP